MTRSYIDPDHPDTYWILDPDQMVCLASATRMTLLDRLAVDGPMCPEDLAYAAALKPTAVYHHVKKLLAVGLVEIAGQRRMPGAKKPQTLYRTPAPKMRLLRAFGDPANATRLSNTAMAILRQAERDVADAFSMADTHAEGPERNHGFFRLAARPDAATLAAINDHLDAIADLLWSSNAENGRPVSLAWALAPLPETRNAGSTNGDS
ncbi:helix-turn-helix domain-containing protein [Hyphobacterium marinum]|uniref:Helix-turn-helix domain-containing protein n=1 Tax=Hyphobacterium marinum TaxID=3116574 RepID=A0ABU7LZA6_9PROT|nr:helix-turn-helix domain-containing protein [Hyphobacterium sp. Y6023]MEE2566855.1 helix-turn-helix domain-containing protein [Hyphobacterium sp. Y6023]